ncbi:hypothetical protein [Actinomadura sp. 3N508]|uniref:hypothetical protein n=1 Tax=Actinomadura sp. 3N508 TaxID=3375153 RepID=UPI0037B23CCB
MSLIEILATTTTALLVGWVLTGVVSSAVTNILIRRLRRKLHRLEAELFRLRRGNHPSDEDD